jgi:TonB family protein
MTRLLRFSLAAGAFAMAIVPAANASAQPTAARPAPNIVAPTVLTHVDAVYPPSALPERKHADVVVIVTVDADGHVSHAEVKESGGAALDEAALVAVRQWTFAPATRDGAPVASRIRVPFHFAPPAPPPEIVAAPPAEEPELSPQPASLEQTSAPAAQSKVTSKGGAAKAAEEVSVIGRALPPSAGASDFNLRVGALANIPRQNATELLKLAPGILLTNEGGEGHAEQIFLRGFDAREGQDIEIKVGGDVVNQVGNLHGNGYADLHFIIPELVDGIRVLEGPYDPRQGNFAVAGSAEYELGLARRGLYASYEVGSFGTKRALLLWGPPGNDRHTFGGVEVYSTDGFGQNRDARHATALGQSEGKLGEHGLWRLTGGAYITDYHSAGVLRGLSGEC